MTRSAGLAKRIEELFPETIQNQLAQIETDLGGRNALVGMLVLAPLTPDLRYVLGLLGDPKHGMTSLAEICAIGNVLPGKLLEHLSAAALLRGKVRASQKIGDGIAAVAEDVMRRAAPYEDACNGGCQGTGSITSDPTPSNPNPSPAPCETCQGTGRLRYSPDLDRQKLAIDMAQLLPKGGGINIAMQQNNAAGVSGGQGALEKLQELTDQLLYGQGSGVSETPVDAEIVPPEETL